MFSNILWNLLAAYNPNLGCRQRSWSFLNNNTFESAENDQNRSSVCPMASASAAAANIIWQRLAKHDWKIFHKIVIRQGIRQTVFEQKYVIFQQKFIQIGWFSQLFDHPAGNSNYPAERFSSRVAKMRERCRQFPVRHWILQNCSGSFSPRLNLTGRLIDCWSCGSLIFKRLAGNYCLSDQRYKIIFFEFRTYYVLWFLITRILAV